MAEAQAKDKGGEQDPSIEEILASIHQIIAEGDENGADKTAAAAPEEATPEPEAKPDPAAEAEEEDVLELTDRLPDAEPEPQEPAAPAAPDPEPEPEPVVEEELEPPASAPEPEQEPPAPEPEPKPEPVEDSALLTEATQAAAAGALGKLQSHMAVARPGAQGHTLEDIARDLLTPMLRAWLDENLPDLIERLVADEIAKISGKSS